VNRFAHLKEAQVPDPVTERAEAALSTSEVDTAALDVAPELVEQSEPIGASDEVDLREMVHLVERRIGIVGKIPASLKDSYDEMLLRSRKYLGRPNSDLAVQAWVELTLEDESFQRRWLKRMQDLRRR
jgi:hypothetical protein